MSETAVGPSKAARPRLLSKVQGAFVGLAYGDALGWPQEFRPKTRRLGRPVEASPELREWTRKAGGRFYSHADIVGAGEYSDDTQLTLAVARSRLLDDDSWWQHFTRTELPLWMLYERGGGGASKRAAASWLNSRPPWNQQFDRVRRYFDAGGNGVAMRVLAHAIRHAGCDDSRQMVRQVVLDGTATHGHPRALVGAALFAFVNRWLLSLDRTLEFGELIRVALSGADAWGGSDAVSGPSPEWLDVANRTCDGGYRSGWHQAVDETADLLKVVGSGIGQGVTADDQRVLRDIGCFGREKGSGTISAVASIYLCSRYAAQPHRGILSAAFASGADTDTIAAMTGCLLGSLVGVEGLPKGYRSIQDREYILSLASRVASESTGRSSPYLETRPVTKQDIDRIKRMLSSDSDTSIDLDGVRTATVVGSEMQVTRGRNSRVQTWQLRTDDGQTLYVKRFTRIDATTADASEPIDPSLGVSRTAKAILLLMHPLTEHRDPRNPDLLTLAEYDQFTRYLQERGRSPSDLLGLARTDLVQGSHSLDPTRIERLLNRRSAFEAASRRWKSSRVWVICRADQHYPKQLKDGLRRECPPLLFGSGTAELLSRGGLAIVGSETANVELVDFAREAGRLVAEGGCVLVSGGFTDVEKAALRSARDAGGGVVTSSREYLEAAEVRQAMPSKDHDLGFVVVSDRDPTLGREVAYGDIDRRLAPLLADAVLVVEANSEQDYPSGILAERLKEARPGRVFVRVARDASQGLASLRELGALDWEWPRSCADRSAFFESLSVQSWQSPKSTRLIDRSREAEAAPHPTRRSSCAVQTSPAEGATLEGIEKFLVEILTGPQRADDIAESLGVEQWAAKGMIRRLVAAGALEEEASTGRYRICRKNRT